MMLKKLCTIHAIEYTEDKCPECEKALNTKPIVKAVNKKPKKKKPVKDNDIEDEEAFKKKVKELIDMYKE